MKSRNMRKKREAVQKRGKSAPSGRAVPVGHREACVEGTHFTGAGSALSSWALTRSPGIGLHWEERGGQGRLHKMGRLTHICRLRGRVWEGGLGSACPLGCLPTPAMAMLPQRPSIND